MLADRRQPQPLGARCEHLGRAAPPALHTPRADAAPPAAARAAARCCCAISAAAPTQYADCLPFRPVGSQRLGAFGGRRGVPLAAAVFASCASRQRRAGSRGVGPTVSGRAASPDLRLRRQRRRLRWRLGGRCLGLRSRSLKLAAALLNRRRHFATWREQRVGLYHGGRRGGRGMVEAARQRRRVGVRRCRRCRRWRRRRDDGRPRRRLRRRLRRLLLRRQRLRRRRFRRRRRRLSRRLGLRLGFSLRHPRR